jgi:4-hydroxy-tetrahydrodipicolinate synthase
MDARPNPPFGEVLTAIITPFDSEGAVDYGTFWRLARHLVSSGSDGIVVTGTTGEAPTLSNIEKIALFKAAVDAVGERASVIAGTGTYDTKESVDLTEQAAEVGVDGVLAVTPYYSKPPQEGLYRHFSAIADATDLPVMLYNIPGRTARLIEVETMARLAQHDRIVAVKDAVEDIDHTREAIAALPDGFAVYSGSDHMTKAIVEAGGVGVVSVASHLVGPQIKRLVAAIKDNDPGQASKIHDGLLPLFEALFAEPSPMPVKAALDVLWDPVGVPRLPLVAASEATLELVESALEAAQGV